MALSAYHQSYAKKSDDELASRVRFKEQDVAEALKVSAYVPEYEPVRVAILGCADKRYVKLHKEIFGKLLDKRIDLTTLDITTEHLRGEDGVRQHDVTRPFPGGPYDIAFAHILLKFIETEKQWAVIKNACDALRSPGLAIFVFNEKEIAASGLKMPDGFFTVPLDRWRRQLGDAGIKFFDSSFRLEGFGGITIEERVLVIVK